jgi:predicted kinase
MFKVVEHLRPYVLMLVGLPGTGKSTFVAQLPSDFVVLSTDNIMECIARDLNVSYNEAFNIVGWDAAEAQYYKEFTEATDAGKDIVIDQTNVSAKARRRKLLRVPAHYHKVAVIFTLPDDVLEERLVAREAKTGKKIPPHIMADMRKRWEDPTKAEGFDNIVIFEG